VTRGQGRIVLHGVRRGLGAHNAVFVPAGKIFALDAQRQMLGQALIVPNDGRVIWPERAQHVRVQDTMHQSELTSLFDTMRRETDQQRAFIPEAMTAQAALISIWLRRQLLSAEDAKRASAAERLTHRFCDLLANNLGNGWNAADYAEQLDITATHLARVCKQSSGMSAADIISHCTFSRARELLSQEDVAIKTLAETLGFGSAAYFTRFIQNHSGMTPSQLRKLAHPQGR
jgi:AraC family transcriptional activator of pobA